MIQVSSEQVPIDQFAVFHSLIKRYNGRYISDPYQLQHCYPYQIQGCYVVNYTFESISDHNDFAHEWCFYQQRMTMPIREKISFKFKIISFVRKFLK